MELFRFLMWVFVATFTVEDCLGLGFPFVV
jgi:hypothetical protein